MRFTNFAPQVDLDEAASSKYADAEGLVTKAEFVRLGKNDLTTKCNLIDRHVFQQKIFRLHSNTFQNIEFNYGEQILLKTLETP